MLLQGPGLQVERHQLVAHALSGPQQQQRQQQQPEGPPAAWSRSGVLRLALLSVAAASSSQLLAMSPSAAAAAAVAGGTALLPPLGPATGATAGPRSALLLADAQLLPLPPGPIAFPRRQLGLNFAVMLMRSGYDAVDDLDFIAMVSAGLGRLGGLGVGVGVGWVVPPLSVPPPPPPPHLFAE